MKNELIHVNTNDQVVGYGEKITTHKAGLLHRAFSLFIYSKSDKKFLIQKRSIEKYHSGGKWSNSCCSHPYRNETWYDSLQRASSDELNLSLKINRSIQCKSNLQPQFIDDNLFYSGSFIYYSGFDNMLSEHELDYVFVYFIDSIISRINFNKSEVSDIKWLSAKEIKDLLDNSPADFSSWFINAFELVEKSLGNIGFS